MLEHEQYMEALENIKHASEFATRERTICAMLEVLDTEKELFHEPEYFEREVRKRVPLQDLSGKVF